MIDKRKILKFFYKIAPGGAYALAATILRFLCEIIAISLFPGYSYTSNMISDLGDYKLNFNLFGRTIFNLGMIFNGLLILPYFFYLNDYYKSLDDRKVDDSLRMAAVYTSIFSSIAISLIGVFLSFDSFIMFYIHGVMALIGFLLSAISNLMWGILMLKTSTFTKWLGYYGLLPSVLCVIFIFTWQPLIEWVAAFSITFYIFAGSTTSLVKKY